MIHYLINQLTMKDEFWKFWHDSTEKSVLQTIKKSFYVHHSAGTNVKDSKVHSNVT